MEAWIQNDAMGEYRDELWDWANDQVSFENGDAVTIDPFRTRDENAASLWAAHATFVEYVTDDIAKIYVPEASDKNRCWFKEEAGEYYIHERYLTPQ